MTEDLPLKKDTHPRDSKSSSDLVAEQCYKLSCKVNRLCNISNEIAKQHLGTEKKAYQEC